LVGRWVGWSVGQMIDGWIRLADFVTRIWMWTVCCGLQVHDMDWIDLAWPWFYKELQTQSTNALDSMMYPKVQKSVSYQYTTGICHFIR